jgi:hypothetical protein
MTRSALALVVLPVLFAIPTPACAQWLKAPHGVPRKADGQIDLSAPAPKTADGKPDIRGVWQLPLPPLYLQNLTKDLKAGELQMTAWAQVIYDHRRATESKDDPHHSCIVSGVPRSWLPPYPSKIFTAPDETVILFEAVQTWRQIFTD